MGDWEEIIKPYRCIKERISFLEKNQLLILPDVSRVGVGPLEDRVLGKVVDHCKPVKPAYFTSQKTLIGFYTCSPFDS